MGFLRASFSSKGKGLEAEDFAHRFLKKQGLKSVTRNYHCRSGEIDLVMAEDQTLVFVEVRYRRSEQYGSGAETVTAVKQGKLIRTAEHFLLNHKEWRNNPCRFDVVSLSGEVTQSPHTEWIKDAFGATTG